MVEALKTLNVKLEEDWDNKTITVHGCGGRFASDGATLFLGNAGTAMRCEPAWMDSHALRVMLGIQSIACYSRVGEKNTITQYTIDI